MFCGNSRGTASNILAVDETRRIETSRTLAEVVRTRVSRVVSHIDKRRQPLWVDVKIDRVRKKAFGRRQVSCSVLGDVTWSESKIALENRRLISKLTVKQ